MGHFLAVILAAIFFMIVVVGWCFLLVTWVQSVCRIYGLTVEASVGWPFYREKINIHLLFHVMFGRGVGAHRVFEVGFLNWYLAIASRGRP